MQKYFVNIDGQQSGPFSKDDLKLMRITRSTYVWFEGQDHWEEMGSIPELSDLFRSEPPLQLLKTQRPKALRIFYTNTDFPSSPELPSFLEFGLPFTPSIQKTIPKEQR